VRPLRDAEREYIPAAFEPNDGNRTLAAQQLEVRHVTRFRNGDATASGVAPDLRGRTVALRDALEDARVPVVEVHISDPAAREPFRHTLVTATAVRKVIVGKGLAGYLEALDFVTKR
jgi:hypothetical protein